MNKEMFTRWNASGKGGTFKITISGSELAYEIVSGSAIETELLIKFLWFAPQLEEVRKTAAALTRKGKWRVNSHQGMSGCCDWWIEYLDEFGIVRGTRSIIHCSMNDKSNIKTTCWVKDLYDLLTIFKNKNIFEKAFDQSIDDGYEFHDITSSILEKRKAFNESSFESWEGFSQVYDNIDENKLYE